MTDEAEEQTITGPVPLQEVPNEENLVDVRRVLEFVAAGHTSGDTIALALSMNPRHVRYWLEIARTIGWLLFEPTQLSFDSPRIASPDASADNPDGRPRITVLGKDLLACPHGSHEERVIVGKSLLQSDHLQRIAGDFLVSDISKEALARRLHEQAKLSAPVARQRARTLLQWKRYVQGATMPPGTRTSQPDIKVIPAAIATAPSMGIPLEPLEPAQSAYLGSQIERARLLLLLGPGFSRKCISKAGTPPPTDIALKHLLWDMLYPGEPIEQDASLVDLVATATTKAPKALSSLLKRHFAVVSTVHATEYRRWLDLPVARVYTLSLDDMEEVIADANGLRRMPVPISSADATRSDLGGRTPYVHLRGRVANGTATFATIRTRDDSLAERRLLSQFEADFLAYPFLITGDAEDEHVLWEHIQLRGDRGPRGTRELRPKSLLVCPQLSRARRELLDHFNIVWIQRSPLEFANELGRFATEIEVGHRLLANTLTDGRDLAGSIGSVSALVAAEPSHRTDYLLGKQPTWDDIRSGRAVFRDSDAEIEAEAVALLSQERAQKPTTATLVLTGTAGSGKSTALMRLAMKLSASGHRVGWLPRDFDLSPQEIKKFTNTEHGLTVLALDDLDRYSRRTAARHIEAFSVGHTLKLIITAMHSAHLDSVQEHLAKKKMRVVSIPKLTNPDVSRLIDALEADRKLGILTGKTRQYQEQVFREKSGRLLLVAMIEATSGRRFEEKIFEEWKSLPVRAANYYTMIAVASHLGYGLTRQELMLATEATRQPDDNAMLEMLVQGKVVDRDMRDRHRCLHRLIAETLIKELRERSDALTQAHVDLSYAVTHTANPGMSRDTIYTRFLKRFINNRYLFGMLDLEDARRVYEEIEPHLYWDYHYWLQRGSLEVAEGDVRAAEQYLNTAKSLNDADHLVMTEYAYMLMRLAVSEPTAPRASDILEEGVAMLRAQISHSGGRDRYPYHVLGSQGLAWVNRRVWRREERIRFLEAVLRDMREGRQHHPRERELEGLEQDLQRKMLSLSAGLED